MASAPAYRDVRLPASPALAAHAVSSHQSPPKHQHVLDKPTVLLFRPQILASHLTSSLHMFIFTTPMPHFLSRIFSDNPFRKDARITDARRVLIKSSANRLSFFDRTDGDENVALKDGASVAGSSSQRPILAPSVAEHERIDATTKRLRVRRRLSKKNHASS
jgi:hypothetical protein